MQCAETYERLLVPALFAQWAGPAVTAAGVAAGHAVLDVACGTGVAARAAVRAVGGTGAVTGLDANPAMLAVARRLAPGVTWSLGSAEDLPLPDEAYDAVTCLFGLMLFRNRGRALAEMDRVLRRGRRLVVTVFDKLENQPGYAALADAYERVAGASVADTLRAPFALGDVANLSRAFASTPVVPSAISLRTGTARFADVRAMVRADVEGWFPFADIRLEREMIEAVVAEAGRAMQRFVTAFGRIEFPVGVHFVVAEKPS